MTQTREAARLAQAAPSRQLYTDWAILRQTGAHPRRHEPLTRLPLSTKGLPLKRLLVVSLLAAAVLAPTAAAKTITVATASSMVPGDGVTIVRVFHSYPRALPRAMYVVTSGQVGS